MQPKALLLLMDGVEEIEAICPIDILRRADIAVTTASCTPSLQVKGRSGVTLHADGLLDALAEDFLAEALILPGGPGTASLRQDPRVLQRLRQHHQAGKLLAAICAAPTVLREAGLTQGRRISAHPSVAQDFPQPLETAAVSMDFPLLTSRGAGTALPFALALASHLAGREKAEAIAQAICFS